MDPETDIVMITAKNNGEQPKEPTTNGAHGQQDGHAQLVILGFGGPCMGLYLSVCRYMSVCTCVCSCVWVCEGQGTTSSVGSCQSWFTSLFHLCLVWGRASRSPSLPETRYVEQDGFELTAPWLSSSQHCQN